MNSINDLYRQVIVEHYKNPRNKGLKEGPEYRSLRLKNPSCGDDVTIQVKTNDNIVEEVHHNGSGCSICCSSASVMSEIMKGKTISEAEAMVEDFYALIKGEEPTNEEALDEAMAFMGVSQFPARVKCATLSWKAFGALLIGEEGVKDIHE